MSAPPPALLASAIVFGIVLGFGAAFVSELRHPRLADAHEVERYTGVRVVSVIRPRPPSPERGRRLADRMAPPHIDPGNDAHQLVWLFVAPPPSTLLMLTVSGEESAIAAIVASNLGAVAADEARNVLVIDTDATACPVASALRLHAQPGVVDIIDNRMSWPEATQHATIGRDRVIAVVASGTAVPAPNVTEVSETLRRDAARLARHYDTVLVVASREQTLSGLPAVLPMQNVLYCARIGHTRFSDLTSALDGIRKAGGNPIGVVLWDDVLPAVLTPEELAAGSLPQRTSEMEALARR
jgi:Mrp family chromosome partitioning ATPase